MWLDMPVGLSYDLEFDFRTLQWLAVIAEEEMQFEKETVVDT
jgi:hypothetical protein